MRTKHLFVAITSFALLSCSITPVNPPTTSATSPETRYTVITIDRTGKEPPQNPVPIQGCKAFIMPTTPNPPHIPDLPNDPDSKEFKEKLLEHVVALHDWMEKRDTIVETAYTKYSKACKAASKR